MKTEMMIMEAFKDFIIKRLFSHFNTVEYGDELTPLSENSVLIDFPDVDNMRKENRATVTVLDTSDKWIGITYKEDKPKVQEYFKSLSDRGVYPSKLWD